MSNQITRSGAALFQKDDALMTMNGLIAAAVAACARVRDPGVALHQHAAQQLRAVREAGRRLSLVQRSDGGRPLNNSSRGLTSYQCALKQAGISRQTAHAWRRVAAIPNFDFEQFIADATLTMGDLTISALLRARDPRTKAGSEVRTMKLLLSDSDYREFKHRVGVLGAVHATHSASETVMAVLGRAYRDWLATQTRL
jgi:hypothetical protein